jgi:ABC-2 type transport system permease protein
MNKPFAALARVFVLTQRDLRELWRSPATIGLMVVGPVIAAILASLALGQPPKVHAAVVVVGAPSNVGDVSELAQLASDSHSASLRWEQAASAQQARAMVESGQAAAALILPLGNPPRPTVQVIVNRHAPIPAALATSAAHTLAARLAAAQVGATEPPRPSTQLAVLSPGRRSLNGGELYGPVVAIFFLFLSSGFVARGLQAERERGTLSRLRAMPIGPAAIVASKLVTTLVIGVVEFTAVLATMTLIYGARWGSLWELGLVLLALTLAVAAIALVVASFARTPMAAYSVGMLIALALGALGGNLVPLQNLPDAARRVADTTPNGLAIRTMRQISSDTIGFSGVVRPVALILAFALVVGTVGYVYVRKVVEA